jgi:hypothetical protein
MRIIAPRLPRRRALLLCARVRERATEGRAGGVRGFALASECADAAEEALVKWCVVS